LDRFFGVMRELAADGGTLLLNEFHPVQRKLFWPEGPHHYQAFVERERSVAALSARQLSC
jgi:hypothetical protein